MQGEELSRREMEQRRLAAAEDLRAGMSQAEAARKYNVSRTTTSRWNGTLKKQGREGLVLRQAPGRPTRLSRRDLEILPSLYYRGPRVHGYNSDWWHITDLQDFIKRRFGVSYHEDHIYRLLQFLGIDHCRTKRRKLRRLA